MASQKDLFKREQRNKGLEPVYEAFETFVSGSVTGSSALRAIPYEDGSTWAFVGRRGINISNQLLHEMKYAILTCSCTKVIKVKVTLSFYYNFPFTGFPETFAEMSNPEGQTSSVVLEAEGNYFMAEATGASMRSNQVDNFRVASSLDAIYPKIDVIDDVTSWLPGINVRGQIY